MTRVVKSVGTVAVAVAAVLGGSMYAFAGWAPVATPAVLRMRTAEMPAGNAPSVVRSGRNAVIAWAPSRLTAGVRAQDYTVVRRGAAGPVVACAAITALTCRDKAVPAGTWTWQVQPRYENWTGELSAAGVPLVFAGPARPAASPGVAAPGAVEGLGEAPATEAPAVASPPVPSEPAPPPRLSPEPESPAAPVPASPSAGQDDVDVDVAPVPAPSTEPGAA